VRLATATAAEAIQPNGRFLYFHLAIPCSLAKLRVLASLPGRPRKSRCGDGRDGHRTDHPAQMFYEQGATRSPPAEPWNISR
jgi:hypothetical protein